MQRGGLLEVVAQVHLYLVAPFDPECGAEKGPVDAPCLGFAARNDRRSTGLSDEAEDPAAAVGGRLRQGRDVQLAGGPTGGGGRRGGPGVHPLRASAPVP